MNISVVDNLMSGAGFTKGTSTTFSLGQEFTVQVNPIWLIYAYAGKQSQQEYEDVVLGLVPTNDPIRSIRGTRHEVMTAPALARRLGSIMQALSNLAANDASLKCPKCNWRWIHPKKPSASSLTRPSRNQTGEARSQG